MFSRMGGESAAHHGYVLLWIADHIDEYRMVPADVDDRVLVIRGELTSKYERIAGQGFVRP